VRLTVYRVCANVQFLVLAVIMSAIDGLTTDIQCYTKSNTSYDNSLHVASVPLYISNAVRTTL
jgi:hypothetical protein